MTLRPFYRYVLTALLVGSASGAAAQDLEPQAFSQAPVGMNFGVVALGYADGKLLFDGADFDQFNLAWSMHSGGRQ